MPRYSTEVHRGELIKTALGGETLRYHTGFGIFEFDSAHVIEAMLNGESYFEEDGVRVYFKGSVDVNDVELRDRLTKSFK